MKIHKHIYIWLAVVLAFIMVSCGNETDGENRNYLALDTLQFTNDHKTAFVNANVVGNPMMEDPADTTRTKYLVYETSTIGDTLSSRITPKIKNVQNVARERIKQLDIKVVVIVDLTMEQVMVNEAKISVQKLRRLFSDGSIYVSFMTDSTNISVSTPLSDALLEDGFISESLEHTNKYLYRNILAKIKECSAPDLIPGRNKALIVMSDGVVWGMDSPMDPDHFVVQQALLDYANEQGDKVPVFFAGMSSDESLSAETNTTMQLVCDRTGGVCNQGFNIDDMHHALCKIHHINAVDLQYELEYPSNRVFWGEPTNLIINCIQGDSLVAYGTCTYHAGSIFTPIVLDGIPLRVFVFSGFILIAMLILICYLVLQFLVPYIRYEIFRRKYVATYTGTGMTVAGNIVATNCYFCKAPFEPGDLIVGRCEHTMHKECWDENDYHCTEYGTHCPDGSHFYDTHNLFNPKNAPYYMRWVLCAMVAAILAWCIFYIIPINFKTDILLTLSNVVFDSETSKHVFDYTYRLPSYGMSTAALLVGFVTFLVRRRMPFLLNARNIFLRSFVAGIGVYIIFFIDVLVCTAMRLEKANELVGALGVAAMTLWIVFVASYQTEIRVKWKLVGIAFLVRLVGSIIATSYYWGIAYDFRVLQLFTLVAYNVILMLALAFNVKRSEHYFLRVEGSIKTMDIALYKWLRTSPSTVVTIGRSVDCDLQLSWDIDADIAPLQAEIVTRNGMPCLYAYEDGVTCANDKPLHEGDYLRLYHGVKFRIGNTDFTYVEKDK